MLGLRALGVEVWWDEDMPGVDWQYELEQRVVDMAAVLVLWSVHSQKSKNVRDEARLADKKDKLINALVGIAEPPAPFDRINGLSIDGFDGREPHRGWSRLVQTTENHLVNAGVTEPGKVTAELARIEQGWHDRKRALAQAQDAFGEAQSAVEDAANAAATAAAELATAQQQLAKAGEMQFSREILRAAHQDCDAKAAASADANAAHDAARERLSQASRELKSCTAALDAPYWGAGTGAVSVGARPAFRWKVIAAVGLTVFVVGLLSILVVRWPGRVAPLPGDWLVNEWVIDQPKNHCYQRLQITRAISKDQLIFNNPDETGAISPEKFWTEGDTTLVTSAWRYTKMSNGHVRMEKRDGSKQVKELSKCGS